MKYLALALTLLFALGSHAASLETMMADAPSQLDQIRSAVGMYLTQVKDHTKKALDHLDDTEYKTYKVQLSSSLDDLAAKLHDYQQQAAPHTDNIVAQVTEALEPLRATIQADIDALKAELEPKRAKLREVLDKHLEDYKVQIEPLATELATKWTEESAAMRAKIQPLADQLSAKIAVNVEETKAALIPIVQAVSEKLMERVKNLQEMAKPYYDEYKEHVNKAIDDMRAKAGTLDAEQLRSQVAPHLTELSSNPAFVQVRAKVEEIYQTIHDAINKA